MRICIISLSTWPAQQRSCRLVTRNDWHTRHGQLRLRGSRSVSPRRGKHGVVRIEAPTAGAAGSPRVTCALSTPRSVAAGNFAESWRQSSAPFHPSTALSLRSTPALPARRLGRTRPRHPHPTLPPPPQPHPAAAATVAAAAASPTYPAPVHNHGRRLSRGMGRSRRAAARAAER